MAFPTRVLASGNSGLAVEAICGDVVSGVTAAGTTEADATAVSSVIVQVSTTAASTGIRLPAAERGAMVFVRNDGANTLTVYPATGGSINGAASDSLAAAKGLLLFGLSSTAWVVLDGA